MYFKKAISIFLKILFWLPKKVFNLLTSDTKLKSIEARCNEFEYLINNFSSRLIDLENGFDSHELKDDEFHLDLRNNYHMLESKLWEYNYTENIILYEHEKSIEKLHKELNNDFNPLVSIIIPAYNGANYLGSAINSALNQTYKNIEIIVVNDGSNDNGETEKIALSYGDKIKYYNKVNGGVSSALNLGIEKMTGEYFAWLSHDDLYMPDHIEKHIEHLRIFGTDNIITLTDFDIIDENSNIKHRQSIICSLHCYNYKLTKIKPEYSLLQGEINGGSILIPKKAFETYGLFNENLRIAQEREMWSRLMKTYTFVNIPYITASLREHSSQVTNTNPNTINETNEYRLNIIDNLSEEAIIRLEKNKYNFYQAMEEYYKRQGLSFLQTELKKRKEKLSENNVFK